MQFLLFYHVAGELRDIFLTRIPCKNPMQESHAKIPMQKPHAKISCKNTMRESRERESRELHVPGLSARDKAENIQTSVKIIFVCKGG